MKSLKSSAVKKKKAKKTTSTGRNQFWTKLSLSCLKNWPITLALWLALLTFGAFVYTQAIPRDGFPSVNVPVIFISSSYFSSDAQAVDQDVAQPLNKILNEVEGVTYVQTTSNANGTTSFIGFASGTEVEQNNLLVQQALKDGAEQLPQGLDLKTIIPEAASYLGEYDLLLTVYDQSGQSDLKQIQTVADSVSQKLSLHPDLEKAETISLITTGQQDQNERQTGFNQIGLTSNSGELQFYQAVHVGVSRHSDKIDTLGLTTLIEQELSNLNLSNFEGQFEAFIIEDFSIAIKKDINNLENNLFAGLIIIGLISFLLISWRAAIVIALFMVSVLAGSIALLYVLGYSLNIITLFALILALGLLVDDAVIMVEALDVTKNRKLKPSQVVKLALDKTLLASLSGTLTTILVFIPLIFIEGILGDFIRLIPITLMLTLLISFLFSITLIPTLARFTILKESEKDIFKRLNPILKLENCIAHSIAQLPLLLKTKPLLGRGVMLVILATGAAFIFASFNLASKINVSVFPPQADSDQLIYSVEFPADYNLTQAERSATEINSVLADTLPTQIDTVNYSFRTVANQHQLEAKISLKSLAERNGVRSPNLIEELQDALDQTIDPAVNIFVYQSDSGPPGLEYPFSLSISAKDEVMAQRLAQEIRAYLVGEAGPTFTQPSGEIVTFKQTRIQPLPSQVIRLDDQKIINLQAQYSQLTVSDSILNETEALIKDRFDEQYLIAQGYDGDILDVEIPLDSFEESFQSLRYIFPTALLLIYILLIWQFRSYIQPIIIFIALPFALAGIFNYLYFSQSSYSFIGGIGLISLMGIAINNTILLVSYTNSAREKLKLEPVEAISQALRERFRPLIITTSTTTLALLPLALNDFFWQNLAWTIIWGLVSSTILVLFVFPYCYLGVTVLVEKLKRKK